MVFNIVMVESVAHLSAETWQYLACLPERMSSHQLLDFIFCFPLQQLGRLAFCLCTFLCIPPPGSYYDYSSSDSDDSSTTIDYDDYYYYPHSD